MEVVDLRFQHWILGGIGVGGKEKGSKGILHPTPPASESWVVTSSAQPVQECHTAYLNPSPASSMPWTLDMSPGITQKESNLLGNSKPCPLRLWSNWKKFFWPHCAACKILVPRPRIELAPLALEVTSLNYWTTREVPVQHFWSQHQKRSGTHLLHRSSSFQPGWERNGKWEGGRESGLTQETEAGATKLWDEGEAQGFYLIHTICKISSVQKIVSFL